MAECGGVKLPEGFECLDFTLDAAYVAQRFIVTLKGDKGGRNFERQRLKVDALILATALAHGANTLYTSNIREFGNMMKLVAGSKMQVLPLPKLRERQGEIEFDD